jgi:TonB family protein
VEHVEVSESAGHSALDQAAVRVAQRMEFTGIQWDGAPICYVTATPVSFLTR